MAATTTSTVQSMARVTESAVRFKPPKMGRKQVFLYDFLSNPVLAMLTHLHKTKFHPYPPQNTKATSHIRLVHRTPKPQ